MVYNTYTLVNEGDYDINNPYIIRIAPKGFIGPMNNGELRYIEFAKFIQDYEQEEEEEEPEYYDPMIFHMD